MINTVLEVMCGVNTYLGCWVGLTSCKLLFGTASIGGEIYISIQSHTMWEYMVGWSVVIPQS